MSFLLLILCLQDFGGKGRLPPPPHPDQRDHQPQGIKPEEVRERLGEVRDLLRGEFPERLKELESLIEEGRLRDAGRILDDLIRRRRYLSDLKKRDPEGYRLVKKIYTLDHACLQLSQQVRRGAPELREELEGKIAELFDLRESMRAREIEILKKRISELEERLDQRREKKKLIVENRLRELLGQKDIVEW